MTELEKCECGGELVRVFVWLCPKCKRRYVTDVKELNEELKEV